MSIDVIENALASIVYPGLTAVCVLWISIAVARWLAGRRMLDLLLTALAVCGAGTFGLLALSTGLFVIVPFESVRFSIRFGWLLILLLALLVTFEFLRRQHAAYRR